MTSLKPLRTGVRRTAECSWNTAFLPVLLGLLLFPMMAVADELLPPQKVIKATSERLINVLERDRERIFNEPDYVYRLANEILVPHVDMERVSRLALGRYWRRASRSQRQAFRTEFRHLLVRTYATAMRQFRGQAQIQFLPAHAKEGTDDIAVDTRMSQAGSRPVSVSYRMHRKNGNWLVYDVKIEGISLVTNYRSSFARHIREGGVDGLIRRISEKNGRQVKNPDPLVARNGAG